jgi:hypothetical protein
MRLPAGSGKFIVQAMVGVGMLLASFWLTLYGEVMSYGLAYFFAAAALAIAGAVVGLRGALEFVKLVIEELELRKTRE